MPSLWILVSALLTVASYGFMKAMPGDWAFYEIFFVRSLFMLVTVWLLAKSAHVTLKTEHPKLQLLRVSAGILAISFNIIAVRHLPLSTANTLISTSPIFVALGTFLLTQSSGANARMALLAIALGFTGTVIVLRPTLDSVMQFYAILAVASALLSAIVSLTLKKLGEHNEPALRTVFYFGLASSIVGGLFTFSLTSRPLFDLVTEPHLLAACLTTVGSQLAQTRGWGHGHPLLCAGFLFSSILFAVLLGLFIFDEPVTPTLMIGLAIMMVAESVVAWLEYRRTRQAH